MTGGAEVKDRVDHHSPHHGAGTGHRQVREVRREPDSGTDDRPPNHPPREAPDRGDASEREGEAEIDAKEHREPGEDAAGQRPASGRSRSGGVVVTRLQQGDERAERERRGSGPRDRDELQRRHDEHDVEQHRGDRDRPPPPTHEETGRDGHADELHETREPFDEQVRPEDLVDARERPEAPGPVEIQEVLVGHRAVQHAIREDEHEALFHRRAGGVEQRAEREEVRDDGNRDDDPNRRRRTGTDPWRRVTAHEQGTVTGAGEEESR